MGGSMHRRQKAGTRDLLRPRPTTLEKQQRCAEQKQGKIFGNKVHPVSLKFSGDAVKGPVEQRNLLGGSVNMLAFISLDWKSWATTPYTPK